MAARVKPTMPQLIDPNINSLGNKKNTSMYNLGQLIGQFIRKPYPEWINNIMPLLRGYKVPDFTTFS